MTQYQPDVENFKEDITKMSELQLHKATYEPRKDGSQSFLNHKVGTLIHTPSVTC